MPSSCDHGNSGNYAVRHNPAVYYTTLHGCSGADVSYSHLATDLARNQLPAFSFITPNLIDDMHNGTGPGGQRHDDDQSVQPVGARPGVGRWAIWAIGPVRASTTCARMAYSRL